MARIRRVRSHEGTGIVPLGFDENPDVLYVRGIHEGRWAIFSVNLEQPDAPRQLVAADPHMDIDGELLYSDWLRAVVGVAHSVGQRSYLYWNEGFQRLHSRVDRLLPGRHTRIVSSTEDGKRHVVVSVSAVHAMQYHVFDSEHNRLLTLKQAYPALRPEDIRPVKAVTIRARDGLVLPAYLTLPVSPSAGPTPLIVFPHGGPTIVIPERSTHGRSSLPAGDGLCCGSITGDRRAKVKHSSGPDSSNGDYRCRTI